MNLLDSSFIPLLPYLESADRPTLWVADENALNTLHTLAPRDYPLLTIITNRYDIYELAQSKNIQALFNDFDFDELAAKNVAQPQRIIYRISKEKSLSHHIFNQCCQLLTSKTNTADQCELIISGKKQEGIKSYQKSLSHTFNCEGSLKKQGLNYFGSFTRFSTEKKLDDDNYPSLQALATPHHPHISAYTKPGVFGWNKIDKGTELLLLHLPAILKEAHLSPKHILDLGCGYGWIFINLPFYLSQSDLKQASITATDNNATALLCAKANSEKSTLTINIIADDCAKNINETFDLILCNPPFHQGFSHDKSLTEKFLQQTKKHLAPKGIAVFVVNEFIQFPESQLKLFSQHTIFAKEHGFKIIILE